MVAARAKDDRVKTIGKDAWNQYLAVPAVEEPTDQVLDQVVFGESVPGRA
jgi:hypothetical protein